MMALCACAVTTAAPVPPPLAPPLVPYVLENTEVRDIRAAALHRDYQLFVALPDSYATSGRRYPVVFITDANYAFPVARSIASRLHKHAGLEEVIVVGLSYANGESGNYSRRRDYTPTVSRNGGDRSDMPGRQQAFGEAAAYGRFIATEVFPLIARQYRADMDRKIFVGHSYGSLLGLQILLTRPDTFDHYILGSPSLWYDRGVMFDREKAYAAGHRDMPASIFFGIGSRETLAPGKTRSRAEERFDMVADLRDFHGALAAHRYPGLTSTVKVFADEDHASVFPLVLTHGLRSYLKRKQ
ncbi:alpha/beta hydrolase [Massilia dura]|uniref:Alpha/beta hydrolase n=2 Tax=Pseudoduganella dura TaxID=321982 RepID=A0A6I3XEP0_9BURK|nr:alpha/beta hydrolase [Pseudoduganella dura]